MIRRGGREASERRRGTGKERQAGDGAIRCSVKAFQLGEIGNAKNRKPSLVKRM